MGEVRGRPLSPRLLFCPLVIPRCVRIGGDGHPGAPHRSAILPGQLREVFGAFQANLCPKTIPGGALPPAVLFRGEERCTPVIVVRPQPHHRAPDEQRHDTHGRHQRAHAESHRSHWHVPAKKLDWPRTPINPTFFDRSQRGSHRSRDMRSIDPPLAHTFGYADTAAIGVKWPSESPPHGLASVCSSTASRPAWRRPARAIRSTMARVPTLFAGSGPRRSVPVLCHCAHR